MAALTLTIGPITSAITASDATVQAVLLDYLTAYGGPVGGTNQQKADWFINQLKRHIIEAANGQYVRTSRDTAETQAAATIKTRDWV